VKAAVGAADLTAYRSTVEKHLVDLARQLGPAVWGRIVKSLGRSMPYPEAARAAGDAPPAAPAG
jgi:hypothetical protein